MIFLDKLCKRLCSECQWQNICPDKKHSVTQLVNLTIVNNPDHIDSETAKKLVQAAADPVEIKQLVDAYKSCVDGRRWKE